MDLTTTQRRCLIDTFSAIADIGGSKAEMEKKVRRAVKRFSLDSFNETRIVNMIVKDMAKYKRDNHGIDIFENEVAGL